jgi:hypothetical protein
MPWVWSSAAPSAYQRLDDGKLPPVAANVQARVLVDRDVVTPGHDKQPPQWGGGGTREGRTTSTMMTPVRISSPSPPAHPHKRPPNNHILPPTAVRCLPTRWAWVDSMGRPSTHRTKHQAPPHATQNVTRGGAVPTMWARVGSRASPSTHKTEHKAPPHATQNVTLAAVRCGAVPTMWGWVGSRASPCRGSARRSPPPAGTPPYPTASAGETGNGYG